MKKTYIGIVRDHSGSMQGLHTPATKDYNELIASLRDNSNKYGEDIIASVVRIGVYNVVPSGIDQPVTNSSVHVLKPLAAHEYLCYGGTPLFDGVGRLIEQFERVPDINDKDVSFLIMVVTDGHENQSGPWRTKLGETIQRLQGTDKWAFTFRVPFGYRQYLAALGIPSGNILEWAQTEEGMRLSSVHTNNSTENYFNTKSTHGMGTVAMSATTRSFYQTDMSGVSRDEIKKQLWDVTSQAKFLNVTGNLDKAEIKPSVEKLVGKQIRVGSAFYQLTKPEKIVQGDKLIAVRDKKTSKVYSGTKIRSLLGLPEQGAVKIVPGNHGEYDLFIQSKSANRHLVGGTQVMYWENVGDPTVSFKTYAKQA